MLKIQYFLLIETLYNKTRNLLWNSSHNFFFQNFFSNDNSYQYFFFQSKTSRQSLDAFKHQILIH